MEHSRSIFVSSFISDMKYIATSFFFLKEFGLSEKHLVYVNEWGIRCTGGLLQNSIFGLCMGNSAAFCKKDHCIQRQMLPLFQFSVLTSVFFSCELKKKEKQEASSLLIQLAACSGWVIPLGGWRSRWPRCGGSPRRDNAATCRSSAGGLVSMHAARLRGAVRAAFAGGAVAVLRSRAAFAFLIINTNPVNLSVQGNACWPPSKPNVEVCRHVLFSFD